MGQRSMRSVSRKVGIVLDGFADLSGARDFIVSFIDGLNRTKCKNEIVLILRVSPPRSLGARLLYHLGLMDMKRLAKAKLDPLVAAGLSDAQIEVLPRGDRALQKTVARFNLEVVGPLTKCPRSQLNVPWFGYLYDFQHRYLSELFTAEDQQARDKLFGAILSNADAVVVNAIEVKRDVERFFPGFEDKVVPLSLSASPKENWFEADVEAAQAEYGTGSKYFMVSNQFWLHKNHETVVEAFARLHQEYPNINLVLTGDTFDHRAPTRLQDIENVIAGLGVTDHVRILGLIPKLDQIALMRGAVAIVQATSFEGGPGGGSVYDAISLGVPTIVSDIAINREIAHLVNLYFRLNDVADLGQKMEQALTLSPNRSDKMDLLKAGIERREKHGQDIWRAIDLAVETFSPKPS
ncbi:MAG: glycosyltransferase [Pseudomonadota bacterium]